MEKVTKRNRRNKYCSKCDWGMPLRFYNKDNRHKDGLRSECKICQYSRMVRSLSVKAKELKVERASLCN